MGLQKTTWGSGQAGLSLVEVLIASTILGLLITAMVAVTANVARIDSGVDQFRQARNFLKEEIEDPHRHYSKYASITGYANYPGLHLDVNPETGYSGIPALASVVVSDPQVSVTLNGVVVDYKRVRASMTWTDHDLAAQNLVLIKLVTNTK